MVLIIKKKTTKKEIDSLLEKKESTTKGNLSKHFGKLKRNIDGLEFQLEIRKNEDWFYLKITNSARRVDGAFKVE